MRLLLATLAVLLLLVPSANAEVQGWRTSDDHIHTSGGPEPLSTLDAVTTLPIQTLLHNRQGGELTFVRWSDGSNVKQSVPLSVVGTGESEQIIETNLTFDPELFDASGWREIRLTSNFVTSEGQREFTTTRLCVFVVNSKGRSDYCGGPEVTGRCGGGAWYDATDYSVVFVDCRDLHTALSRPLVPGEVVRIRAQHANLFVNLDPKFHAGDPGRVLLENGGTGWHDVVIPTDIADGSHKLHIRDQQANGEAGVYVMPFTVGSTTTEPPPGEEEPPPTC